MTSHINISFSNMAPLKKKRDSKRKKKSWRKIDVTDVDDYLEDVRLEERLGGKFSERKDEELFQIDNAGVDAENVSQAGNKILYNLKYGTSDKRSLRLRESTLPKCFSALENRSKVKDPVIKRNHVKTKDENERTKQKIIREKRLACGILTPKEQEIVRSRKAREKFFKKEAKRRKFNRDIWSEKNKDGKLKGYSGWCSKETVRHTLRNTGKKQVSVPGSVIEKPSLVPSVEPPHPGASYNPSLKDHNALINDVVKKQLKVETEEKHLHKQTTAKFSRMTQEQAEKNWLEEMSKGLSMAKSDSDEEIEGDYTTVGAPVVVKKKTLKQRRKHGEAMIRENELKLKKMEKKKLADVNKVRKFNEMLDEKEKLAKRRKKRRENVKKNKLPFVTKTLSGTKYEPAALDFTLSEELSGNLRNLKTDVNLLLDRFKSLQKRNILQPTVRQDRKKTKRKKYERACTKLEYEGTLY